MHVLIVSLQLAVAVYVFADDGDAVCPEFFGADVDAKAVGEFCRAVFARGCKQVLVIRHKVRAAFLINGI